MVFGIFVYVYYMLLDLVSNVGVSLIEFVENVSHTSYMQLLSCCCVVQFGECVLNELGTVVVVVIVAVVVVVVGCMLIYTMEFISYSYASLGAHALECLSFNC